MDSSELGLPTEDSPVSEEKITRRSVLKDIALAGFSLALPAYGAEKTAKPKKKMWAGLTPFEDKELIDGDGISVKVLPPVGVKEMESGVLYDFFIHLDLISNEKNRTVPKYFYGENISQILMMAEDDVMFDGAKIYADGKTTIEMVVSVVGSVLGGVGGVESIIMGAVQSAGVEAVKRGLGFDDNIKIELPRNAKWNEKGYVSRVTFPGVYSFKEASINVRLGFRKPGEHTILFFPDVSALFKPMRNDGITAGLVSVATTVYRKAVVFCPVVGEPVESGKTKELAKKYLQSLYGCRWDDAFSCMGPGYDKEKFMEPWEKIEYVLRDHVRLGRIETERIHQVANIYNIDVKYDVSLKDYPGRVRSFKRWFHVQKYNGKYKIWETHKLK